MIEQSEVRASLQLHGADMDRAAFRLAVGLTGRTSSGYFQAVKQGLVDALTEAVLAAEVPTLEEWESAAAEDEAWRAAEAGRGAPPACAADVDSPGSWPRSGYAPVRPQVTPVQPEATA